MVDLGYGTTHVWWGANDGTPVAVWYRDGKRIALSQRQLLALSLSLQHGNAEAGYRMGIATTTLKGLLTRLYARLGVFDKFEAALALDWVHIPAELLDASPEAIEGTGGRPVAGPSGAAALGSAAAPTCPSCMGLGCNDCCHTGR